jgi:hypothetical protein
VAVGGIGVGDGTVSVTVGLDGWVGNAVAVAVGTAIVFVEVAVNIGSIRTLICPQPANIAIAITIKRRFAFIGTPF